MNFEKPNPNQKPETGKPDPPGFKFIGFLWHPTKDTLGDLEKWWGILVISCIEPSIRAELELDTTLGNDQSRCACIYVVDFSHNMTKFVIKVTNW